jgi:hypothetical protein
MRYRLRTLLLWVALLPPLLAVAVLGLERMYFNAVHSFRRMTEPNPMKRARQSMPQPRLVEPDGDAEPGSS